MGGRLVRVTVIWACPLGGSEGYGRQAIRAPETVIWVQIATHRLPKPGILKAEAGSTPNRAIRERRRQ